MIYVKKEDNEIKAFAEQKENTIAITEEQWINSGYGMYCNIIDNQFIITEAPQSSLEQLKQEKIKELKNNCQNYICSVYPIFKQVNIINKLSEYTNKEKKTMNEFIEKQRTICNKKEDEINDTNSKEELDNVNTNFEAVENNK